MDSSLPFRRTYTSFSACELNTPLAKIAELMLTSGNDAVPRALRPAEQSKSSLFVGSRFGTSTLLATIDCSRSPLNLSETGSLLGAMVSWVQNLGRCRTARRPGDGGRPSHRW